MDYIINKLNKKIQFYKARGDLGNLKLYLQVRLEYELLLSMAYLWNKNIDILSLDKKIELYKAIITPSIGEIVNITRKLDVGNEVFKAKKVREVLNRYPAFRNEKLGHGYSFEDDGENFVENIEQMLDDLNKVSVIGGNIDLICVEKITDGVLEGIRYTPNGEYNCWNQRQKDCELSKGFYLASDEGDYCKLSPFIFMDEEKIFLFRCIDEVLLGRFRYNQLFETNTTTREWNDFSNVKLSEDEFKKVSINGTIVNKYENNYSSFKYIEIHSMQNTISEFINNKSCVYATLWGHGGVGKTAAVQNYCDKLGKDAVRRFDYILFVSAKDRLYDSYTGTIKQIQDNTTFATIVKNLNRLINNDEAYDIDRVLSSSASFLLVIDDFETFTNEDKNAIEVFIRKLDINRHKVLITTRSNTILGEEIKTNEFGQDETVRFLEEIYFNLFHKNISCRFTEEVKNKIHNITSGRPIFILQFAHICSRAGIEEALCKDIKNSKDAIEFLYGRINDYLSPEAQRIMPVLGVLADSEDMTNLLDKIKYILNMETDTQFGEYIGEIEKLRLIEIIDGRFYKVYSTEILNIMRESFDNLEETERKGILKRINQVSRDRNLDNDHALLKNANSSRYSQTEQEVVQLYTSLINRKNAKQEVKVLAVQNMAEYLYNDRANRTAAIQKLEKYYYDFKDVPSYIRMYSTYLRGNQEEEKAIEVLLKYFADNRDYKLDEVLALFGLLVAYRSMYWLGLREDTKLGYKSGELYESDYQKQIKEQNIEFKNIEKKHGNRLVKILENTDFQKLSSGTRQNLIAAAYHYIEVCIRIKSYQTGRYICNFIINRMPNYTYGWSFNSKLNRINEYDNEKS